MDMYRWFVHNPVTVNILVIVTIVAGLLSAFSINAELFPEFSLDMIAVTAIYPGATPSEVEEGICIKIEEAIKDIEGLKEIKSTANEGMGSVVVEVNAGRDVLYIKDKIKSAIDKITTLPDDVEAPIVTDLTIKRQVMNIALYGNVDEKALKSMAQTLETEIRDAKIGSDVVIQGIRDYEITIEVSEATLRKYNLSFGDLAAAVKRSSLDLPAGVIRTGEGEILIRTIGQRYLGEDYEKIVVRASADGKTVKLKDIAKIHDDFEDTNVRAWFNGKPSAILSIFKSETQDSIKVAAEVTNFVARRLKSLPPGFQLEVFGDTSVMVRDRLELLLRNGFQGLVLVFIVLALFLDIRLAFWVSAGIPVSFLGTMILLKVFGQTLNMISMFALIMALGIIVDDAIVVSEAIYTNMRRGMSPKRAAVLGLREMLWPVMASVATTVVAFMPMMDIPGVMGKFIFVLPVAMISALVVSLGEAIFVLPCHLAFHVSVQSADDDSRRISLLERFRRMMEGFMEFFLDRIYVPVLKQCVNYRYVTAAAAIAILIATTGLVTSGRVGINMFPKMDSEILLANIQFPQGHPFDETLETARRMEASAGDLNNFFRDRVTNGGDLIKNIYTTVGQKVNFSTGAGSNGSHLAMVYVELAGVSSRNVKSDAILSAWRDMVGEIPGIESLEITGARGGPGGKAVEIELAGDDINEIEAATEFLKSSLAEYPGVYQIEDDLIPGKLEARLFFKDKARTLGLTLFDLASQVRQAFYGAEANRIQRGRDEVKVMIRYPQEGRVSINDILEMRVRTPVKQEVPFHEVADITLEKGYSQISRVDGRRVVRVMAEVDDQVTKSERVLSDFNERVIPRFRDKFQNISFAFKGGQQDSRESIMSLLKGFAVAFLIIYGIIATIFTSYTQPVVICFAIPLGLSGAILGHWLTGWDMAMMSLFGMVALAGIVVNNSIILIDFINSRVSNGMHFDQAVISSGKARFRPILITTLTTVAGLLPLMLEKSFQAQFLIPMAVSIAYGLIFATALTLVFTPAMVMIVHDIRSLINWIWNGVWSDPTAMELRAELSDRIEEEKTPDLTLEDSIRMELESEAHMSSEKIG
ncbi:MAG: AcrB/AcrD/AcrF family protein [Candidatus Wallbacteria bacterium HGW-Wallbacteria-1]|jgi:multidrug efflux pump subunit AcrB|uniref:AcrB/AcrD/AcrF family protein n=1 Tax=Candidatus Wallbacteria bacterium HGW-Wallbacteria-1 TaxID=2013854 RepID=A0A2N1PNB3_9BACT|nr:MAG: AcrB/AcrD/AcrF family protein [Candidatus Wallbacteria bacterium HGW-Wallbacteria-1]